LVDVGIIAIVYVVSEYGAISRIRKTRDVGQAITLVVTVRIDVLVRRIKNKGPLSISTCPDTDFTPPS
jgi:hypothetical protein